MRDFYKAVLRVLSKIFLRLICMFETHILVQTTYYIVGKEFGYISKN